MGPRLKNNVTSPYPPNDSSKLKNTGKQVKVSNGRTHKEVTLPIKGKNKTVDSHSCNESAELRAHPFVLLTFRMPTLLDGKWFDRIPIE